MQLSPDDELPVNAPPPVFQGASAPAVLENPWHSEATSFPLNARPLRVWQKPRDYKGAIGYSPFRLGTMHIEGDGIHLNGTGVVQSKWAGVISGSIGLLYVVLRLSIQWITSVTTDPALRVGLMAIPALLFIASIGIGLYQEYRRIPIDITINWEDIRELQVEPKSRWASLLYTGGAPSLLGKPVLRSLTINAAHPSGILLIIEALERRIPDRVRRRVSPYEWTTGRKIVAGVTIGVVLVAVVIAVVYAATH